MVNVGRVVNSRRLGAQIVTVKRTYAGWKDGVFCRNAMENTLQITAFVTVAQPKDLKMLPEGDRVSGAMRFLTTEELHATRNNSISDEIIWRGARFKILTVTPDIDYGFYRAIGTRLDGDSIG